MTLTEVLIASVVGLAVVLSVGQVDMTRIHLMNQVLQPQAVILSEASLAMHHMITHLMQADRVIVLSADNVQFRTPQDVTALDSPASYRWAQYQLIDSPSDSDTQPDTINFYDDTAAGCSVDAKFGVSSPGPNVIIGMALSVIYHDEDSPAPPGGDPPMDDNNTVRISVTPSWSQISPPSTVTETNSGSVTLRAGAYSDVNAGAGDSGTGLLTPQPGGGGPLPAGGC